MLHLCSNALEYTTDLPIADAVSYQTDNLFDIKDMQIERMERWGQQRKRQSGGAHMAPAGVRTTLASAYNKCTDVITIIARGWFFCLYDRQELT